MANAKKTEVESKRSLRNFKDSLKNWVQDEPVSIPTSYKGFARLNRLFFMFIMFGSNVFAYFELALFCSVIKWSTGYVNVNASDEVQNLLPESWECGTNTVEKIIGGTETDLDEFPWMALLEYEMPNGTRAFSCGGMLINKRYVLTAAHCVKLPDRYKEWKLVSVRLGEHDIESDPDCVDNGYVKDCAPKVVNLGLEEKIVHRGYDHKDKWKRLHDLALLRLDEEVHYSDFIKPICLPTTTMERARSYVDQKLFVAGWGLTEKGRSSPVKLKVRVPVTSDATCLHTYRKYFLRMGRGQMCAGGEKGKDSCMGDSGGPLMHLHLSEANDLQWFAIGMVSFGNEDCGTDNWPAVYTRLSLYVDWIRSKLKP